MFKSRSPEEHRSKAMQMLKSGGHANVAKSEIVKAVHAHEMHDHPGKPLTKLATGGKVKKAPGVAVIVHNGPDMAQKMQDRQEAMQQGAVMGAKAAQQHMAGAMGVGAPGGAPPRPPMPMGGPAGSPPMGGAPSPMGAPGPNGPSGVAPAAGMRPPGMKQGGTVSAPDQAGASSGMGRLQKVKAYGASGPVGGAPETVKVKGHIRRKSGGKCE